MEPTIPMTVRRLAGPGIVLLGVAVVALLLDQQSGGFSIQAQTYLRFADDPSLLAGLRAQPLFWPPLYPALLWVSSALGIPPPAVNPLLFLGVLLWMYRFLGRSLAGVHLAYPLALYGLADFNYVNMYQPTAETLLLLLAVVVLSLCIRYERHASLATLLLLSIACAACFLTRYFGLFWIAPPVAILIAFLARGTAWRRITHLALWLAISMTPIGVWLWRTYRNTAQLGGINLFVPREFPEEIEIWNELTGFDTNVWFCLKTHFIDFFSLASHAHHTAVTDAYALSASDWFAWGALLAVAGATLWVLVRAQSQRGGREFWRSFRASDAFWVVVFLAAYDFASIALWTLLYNDPFYTRFFYPSYIFVVLSVFWLYAWVKRQSDAHWCRLPFQILYATVICVQLIRAADPF